MINLNLNMPTKEELTELEVQFFRRVKANKNNFSYWSEKLYETDQIKIPKSVIVSIPDSVVNVCVDLDPEHLLEKFIENTIIPTIHKEFPNAVSLFIKNGTFSDKFNFGEACLLTDFSKENIAKHICEIQSFAMMVGADGYSELILREFIPDDGRTTIYNGMPLRPEGRIFYDFDKKKIIGVFFYWDKDYCFDKLPEKDKEPYLSAYDEIHSEFIDWYKSAKSIIEEYLSNVGGLDGMWSVDFMLTNGNTYLIDMAIGYQSAYFEKLKL